ncbi:MAG: HlyD family secretion protein [Cyanobacteriota bacterium]|jgi:HlyD family secretion protein
MRQVSLKLKEEREALEKPQARRKVTVKLFIPLGLLIAGVAGSMWYLSQTPQKQALELSGRIEGYETDIGAKTAGRITFIAVREGDKVYKGQVLVRQQDDEVKAQLEGAKARLLAAQQQELQTALEIPVIENQIQEIEIGVRQSKQESAAQIYQAEASLASSQAQLHEAKANLEQTKSVLKMARVDYDRSAILSAEGAIPQQQLDQARATLETAQANVKAKQSSIESFKKLVNAAQGQLKQAQTTTLNPEIRNAQLQGARSQLAQARVKLAAAQADVANARATLKETQSRVSDLNIISPIDGVVLSRSIEPGAVVTAGKTLLTVINPQTVYLRGYIPEGEIAKVKIGQTAKVFLDSFPEQALSAKVSAIDTQASFTPENIYFKEDRVKQVFGIKITIDNPGGLAKPGMPADAEIIAKPPTQKHL